MGRIHSGKRFIDKELHIKKITEFEIDYRAGNMDFEAYCKFLFNPLIGISIQEIKSLVNDFINQYKNLLIDSLTYELLKNNKMIKNYCFRIFKFYR